MCGLTNDEIDIFVMHVVTRKIQIILTLFYLRCWSNVYDQTLICLHSMHVTDVYT